ncbi:protein FAM111A-like, partial [Colossoma macropomum]|uniref:protein FAM111A-like n=1 Tax=Colossoma macropomum TaxID=42526 RepID=UPI001863CB45
MEKKDEVQEKRDAEKKHSFKILLENTSYTVDCRDRMTVLEALDTHRVFTAKKDKRNVVIAREDGAVVSTHFPCCLIDSHEELRVNFISGSSSVQQSQANSKILNKEKEDFVTFKVETKGKEGIVNILENSKLAPNSSHVCVYGIKGEDLQTALKDDGRFKGSIFEKNVALEEVGGRKTVFLMSNNVDELNKKVFKIMLIKVPSNTKKIKLESENKDSYKVKNEASEASTSTSPRPQSENTDHSQESANAQSQKAKIIQVKQIPNTEEVLNLLRGQFEGLLKQLKERESLTKPAEVQKFFREEYDKSAQSFSEVKRVKKLMKLSDSVCLICVEGSD